mmetsp:Transcript_17120/g.34652  ORF Transcript_17120/g.34652 Transcript_17120/m.34652 type:complete len:223 (-) Transcript_17120:151-819(-)
MLSVWRLTSLPIALGTTSSSAHSRRCNVCRPTRPPREVGSVLMPPKPSRLRTLSWLNSLKIISGSSSTLGLVVGVSPSSCATASPSSFLVSNVCTLTTSRLSRSVSVIDCWKHMSSLYHVGFSFRGRSRKRPLSSRMYASVSLLPFLLRAERTSISRPRPMSSTILRRLATTCSIVGLVRLIEMRIVTTMMCRPLSGWVSMRISRASRPASGANKTSASWGY